MTFFAGPLPRQFAHRGASGTFPENTLAAFHAAREIGPLGFELDIHATADHEIVVFHDATVDRTTDGHGRVRDHTLAEIRGLDAGFGFSPDEGRTFPSRGRGVSVPTLREVLETFPETPLIIEIKQVESPLEESLAQLLQETASESRVLVFSLEQAPLDRYRALGRPWPTGFGPADVTEFLRRLNSGSWSGYRPPAAAFAVPVRWRGTQIVSAPFVGAAHDLGCEVFVWTVNEPAEIGALLDLGVDGVISDYPERLMRIVSERASSPGRHREGR